MRKLTDAEKAELQKKIEEYRQQSTEKVIHNIRQREDGKPPLSLGRIVGETLTGSIIGSLIPLILVLVTLHTWQSNPTGSDMASGGDMGIAYVGLFLLGSLSIGIGAIIGAIIGFNRTRRYKLPPASGS